MSEAGSDSGGISSHDGSKSDTDSNYNTGPSNISAISSSFKRINISAISPNATMFNGYSFLE